MIDVRNSFANWLAVKAFDDHPDTNPIFLQNKKTFNSQFRTFLID